MQYALILYDLQLILARMSAKAPPATSSRVGESCVNSARRPAWSPPLWLVTTAFSSQMASPFCPSSVAQCDPGGCGHPHGCSAPRHLWVAGLLILASYLIDWCDGALARTLHASTAFGLQLDSLVDMVSLGVAPAVFLYVWHPRRRGQPLAVWPCGGPRALGWRVPPRTV